MQMLLSHHTGTMVKEDIILYAGIASVLAVVGLYLFYWYRERRGMPVQEPAKPPLVEPSTQKEFIPLQLQAYERLVLLSERISLPALVTRIPAGELDARQYCSLLCEQIRMEADHNLTQQIYVSDIAWQSVTKLREQNLFTLNRLLGILPDNAQGKDLSKAIAALIKADPNALLHTVVLEALRKEAKKLL